MVYTPPAGSAAVIPTRLPGSRGVLFLFCRGAGCQAGAALWALDLRSGEAHEVVAGGLTGFYLPTGHIVFARPDGALLVAPFDLDKLVVTGEPVPVLEGVRVGLNTPDFVVARTGTAIYVTGSATAGGVRSRPSGSLVKACLRRLTPAGHGSSSAPATDWPSRPTAGNWR